MTASLLLACLNALFIAAFAQYGKYLDEECPRVRQAMHKMTTDELLLYADGMHRIRKNGKYQIIVNAHQLHKETHRGSAFFFYHTYFVWEVETQIRALGGKFKCFALPMYDWTIDAGREGNPWILNTVLGGDGDPNKLLCVSQPEQKDNAWSAPEWTLREMCNKNLENAHQGCCLKRQLWDSSEENWEGLSAAEEVGEIMERDTFKPMSGGVAFYHQRVHWLFGHGDECNNCAMATGYSPDDPIFMVLHSFAAYLRAIWASCHGYDNLDPNTLEEHPEAYLPGCADAEIDLADGSTFSGDCGVVLYDDEFEFEQVAESSWSITSEMGVTPRMMWDFADWNVQFNHGTFFEKSGLSKSDKCDQANVAASRWFSDEGPMMGSKNAAFDLWLKDKPPPKIVHDEEPEEDIKNTGDLPPTNPYKSGGKGGNGEETLRRTKPLHAHDKARLSAMADWPSWTTVRTVKQMQLVDVKGEIASPVVKDGHNYLMLTGIILLLLSIGLALYAYNNRKRKAPFEHLNTQSQRSEVYGAV